jgi:hypothetical protein
MSLWFEVAHFYPTFKVSVNSMIFLMNYVRRDAGTFGMHLPSGFHASLANVFKNSTRSASS